VADKGGGHCCCLYILLLYCTALYVLYGLPQGGQILLWMGLGLTNVAVRAQSPLRATSSYTGAENLRALPLRLLCTWILGAGTSDPRL